MNGMVYKKLRMNIITGEPEQVEKEAKIRIFFDAVKKADKNKADYDR